MVSKRDYNWIDDPFKEKQQGKQQMSTRTKLVVGCGCLIVLLAFAVAVVLFFSGLMGALAG